MSKTSVIASIQLFAGCLAGYLLGHGWTEQVGIALAIYCLSPVVYAR